MTEAPATPKTDSTFKIFGTDDGITLTYLGVQPARSSEEARRKFNDENEIEHDYIGAISENYFKLAKPKKKVVETTSFEEIDWDKLIAATPVEPKNEFAGAVGPEPDAAVR